MDKYIAQFAWGISEKDNWQNGCEPRTEQDLQSLDDRVTANSLPELLEKLCKLYGVTPDYVLLDCCGEDGRVDIQRNENSFGSLLSPNEQKLWEAGQMDAYLAEYVYKVYRTESVSFGAAMEQFQDLGYAFYG